MMLLYLFISIFLKYYYNLGYKASSSSYYYYYYCIGIYSGYTVEIQFYFYNQIFIYKLYTFFLLLLKFILIVVYSIDWLSSHCFCFNLFFKYLLSYSTLNSLFFFCCNKNQINKIIQYFCFCCFFFEQNRNNKSKR
jgi:hypothetical protein